jgi:hypothetical protein
VVRPRGQGRQRNILANIFDTYPSGNTIVLFTKPFYFGISLSAIISIDVKDKICNVKYYLEGQKREISGELRDFGAFEGETDFGDFKLDMGKLKKLTFKDMPSFSKSKKPASYDTILVFTNGNRIPVADFRRFNT